MLEGQSRMDNSRDKGKQNHRTQKAIKWMTLTHKTQGWTHLLKKD